MFCPNEVSDSRNNLKSIDVGLYGIHRLHFGSEHGLVDSVPPSNVPRLLMNTATVKVGSDYSRASSKAIEHVVDNGKGQQCDPRLFTTSIKNQLASSTVANQVHNVRRVFSRCQQL